MDTQYKRASKARKAELMKTHINNMQSKIEYSKQSSGVLNDQQHIRIGAILLDCLIASGANLFAKGKVYNRYGNGYSYVIYMTQSGKDVLATAHTEAIRRLRFVPQPMVVPPKPWTNNYDGGLYTKTTPIMKMKTPAGVKELQKQRIDKVYPILNRLQNTKWRINTFVLDVITHMYELNIVDPKSPQKLPRLYGGLPTSNIMDAGDIIKKENYGKLLDDGIFANKADFIRWRRDYETTTIGLDGEMGRRIQLISALGMANKYRHYDELYFSYTLDSRGRVYTQQSVITPQGSAEVKSMLEFAEGRHLNERGVYWFKIHTANVFGMDKEDFDERLRWFDEYEREICEVGNNPLGNIGSWAYADSPFEFLAACHSWTEHLKGNEVHVPIQLDATNSGVQIYSGLLGDLDGAKTVNVVNIGKRADVYQIVADKVNQSLYSENYPKIFEVLTSDGKLKTQGTHIEAHSIRGKITRSIVKRNVMTVPYSVSKRGMSDQLWDIMDDAKLQEKEWWNGDPWVVNKLLTDLNYEAIYDTIPGARLGQDYLVSLANLCNDKDGMIYKTPIYNVPVVQKKPRMDTNTVQTVLGTLNIKSWIPNSIDKIAQKNGSAPNYIHSIDSTLLLRVIENMSTNIGVIHDCFISHANDGDEVRDEFKKAYVEIMEMKPLELISKQLDPDGTIEVPYIGTLNFDDVLKADYIIS
jgi:DNA-directed RNA polymerase